MDAFIIAARDLANQLWPTLLVILLGLLIVLVYKLIKLISQLTDDIKPIGKILDTTSESVEKLQGPLDTVNKLSNTVDKVHDSGVMIAKDVAIKTKSYIDEFMENRK